MVKIFQIWIDGLERKDSRNLTWMRDNLAFADNYLLVSNENFLDVPNWIDVHEIESAALKDPRIANMAQSKGGRVWTDILRLWMFTQPEYSDWVYLDCDARILAVHPKESLPAFPMLGSSKKNCDIFAIAGNGNTMWFRAFLDHHAMTYPNRCVPLVFTLQRFQKAILPSGIVEHENAGTKDLLNMVSETRISADPGSPVVGGNYAST